MHGSYIPSFHNEIVSISSTSKEKSFLCFYLAANIFKVLNLT